MPFFFVHELATWQAVNFSWVYCKIRLFTYCNNLKLTLRKELLGHSAIRMNEPPIKLYSFMLIYCFPSFK
jgi:hypothetical protein